MERAFSVDTRACRLAYDEGGHCEEGGRKRKDGDEIGMLGP